MRRLALALALLWPSWALAQNAPSASPAIGVAGAYNSVPLTCTDGQACWLQTDSHGQLLVSGGGGGGAVTIADGADVAEGAKADAAWVSGSGSVIAILKNMAGGIASSIPAGTNYIGQIGSAAFTSGGWTPKWFVAANSDNATNLKASAGIVHAVQVFGIGSAPAYLKFYDKASSPTCGSDTIVKQIMIPAAATAANGAGAVAIVLDTQFSTGISYCVVTGITASDDTSPSANLFVVNIDWK